MFTPDEGEKGIVDTGTTLILLSSGGTSDYYSGTGATYDSEQQGYIFDCTTTLPDFSITIGSYKATVPGSDINFNPAGEDANGNARKFESSTYGTKSQADIFRQYALVPSNPMEMRSTLPFTVTPFSRASTSFSTSATAAKGSDLPLKLLKKPKAKSIAWGRGTDGMWEYWHNGRERICTDASEATLLRDFKT